MIGLTKCDYCRFFTGGLQKYCCMAFPDGIPRSNYNVDRTIPCANGYNFELAEGKEFPSVFDEVAEEIRNGER